MAIWDLRFHTAPLALTGAKAAAGDVCEVRGCDECDACVTPVGVRSLTVCICDCVKTNVRQQRMQQVCVGPVALNMRPLHGCVHSTAAPWWLDLLTQTVADIVVLCPADPPLVCVSPPAVQI